MRKTPTCSVGSDDVLQVESKWPYLPITPTYDQYVQQWVVMPEREGFHLKTEGEFTVSRISEFVRPKSSKNIVRNM